jgi:inorganic triphosphatase YgiF
VSGRRIGAPSPATLEAEETEAPSIVTHDPTPARPPPHVEIELKLAVAPEHVPRLARLPLLRHATVGRVVTRTMRGIYYDTPNHDLQRSGVALRLRREGSRWMQTIKGAGRVEAGLHQRDEVEARVPGPFLDHDMVEAALDGRLPGPTARAQLQPVFVTDFRRRVRHLAPSPGVEIELSLDVGSITAADRRLPISEVELELKAGSPLPLLELADVLVQALPLRLEPLSKAARGYLLARGTTAVPCRAADIALSPDLSVTQAWRTIVFACVGQLQANEAGVMAAEDPEYLHQARVALRRLRSAFSVFGHAFPRSAMEPLLGEIRWLDRTLGPARDWDVFVLATLPPLRAAFEPHDGLEAIAVQAAAVRSRMTYAAIEALASSRYVRLLLQLVTVFHRHPGLSLDAAPAQAARAALLLPFAAHVLSQGQRKVRKRARTLKKLDHGGLHELRIAVKKLRYASEFFASLYERKRQRRFVGALAQLQEHLGAVNDAAIVENLCRQLDSTQVEVREAVGLLRGWAAANARTHVEQLEPAWKNLRDSDPFWE